MACKPLIHLDGVALQVRGRFLKTAQLNDEYYVGVPDPLAFIENMKRQSSNLGADVFTFVQDLHDREAHFQHVLSWDEMAVLPLTTYAHWFDKQLTFKPRNRLRKAWKNGVEARVVEFSDDFVRDVMVIYNETPLRQGKRNWHYRKDFDTVKREHATFLERSEFIGAYARGELIGFAKITHSAHHSIVMNMVAKVSQRDKAPTNALLAKSIEQVTARQIPLLNFGVWGRRGLNEFKLVNAFECARVPRYHVPLTLTGACALKLNLHRGLKERLPEPWIVKLADTRASWNEWRHRQASAMSPASSPVSSRQSEA
jgi:hypothetical protein